MTLRQVPLTVPEQIQDIYEQLRRKHPGISLQEITSLIQDNPCECDCFEITQEKTFDEAGLVTVHTGDLRWYPPFPCRITSIRASVNTAPTGDSIIIDVNKNGGSVFTTGQNPEITAGTLTALSAGIADPYLLQGDYLQFDVDQVGSTITGSDLSITLGLVVQCGSFVQSAPLIVPPTSCDFQHAALITNPYHYWPLQETVGSSAADLGSGPQLGSIGAGITLGVGGAYDSTKAFENGASHVIGMGTAAPTSFGDCTFAAWVYPTDFTHRNVILAFGNSSGINFGWSGALLQLENDAFSPSSITSGGASLLASTWAFVGAKRSGSTVTFYINGAVDSSGTWVATSSANQNLNMFNYADSGLWNLTGRCQDVLWWDRALSDAEFAAMYAAACV